MPPYTVNTVECRVPHIASSDQVCSLLSFFTVDEDPCFEQGIARLCYKDIAQKLHINPKLKSIHVE